jgi:hypothetical protein
MSDSASPRRPRRRRYPQHVRESLDAIGSRLETLLPPPSPPNLGEGLLEQARRNSYPMPDPHDRGPMPGDAGAETRILIALARIEERQNSMLEASKQSQQAAEARHINVMAAISTFVPRSEIDKDNRAIHERIDALNERIGTMDKRVWGAVIGALGTFGSVLLTKVGLLH